MSLTISPEVESRILANAREAGVSAEDYLGQVISENEHFSAEIRRIHSSPENVSSHRVQGKIARGLAQLERGEFVDGEAFMKAVTEDLEQS